MRLHKVPFWKITLILVAVLLALLSTPARAACLMRVADFDPHLHAEQCDSVSMRYDGVRISLTVFDAALAASILMMPGLLWLAWHTIPTHRAIGRALALAPDSPPPRPVSA